MLRKYVSKLTSAMQPCVTQILPMSGVCGEHDTVWLSGCWFGLHKPTGTMLGKVIWLLDYGYCMGSTFLFIYCSLSLMLMLRIVQCLPLFPTVVIANWRNFLFCEHCSVACRQRYTVCVYIVYIYTLTSHKPF